MAAGTLFEEISDKKKKRKKECQRKLLIGEKVEVRNVNEGLEGAWNSGIVTGEDNLVRNVKYDNHNFSDGSGKLIEKVPISPMIEGDLPAFGMPKTYRGLIRPLPPVMISNLPLRYGLCVDAYVKHTWLEGVVFDYEYSSEERLIFFPDFNIQEKVRIEQLRLTQDWNEISEHWTPRGYWLFLGLVEEHTKEIQVDFSVRQIWCTLNKTEEFKKRITNWTCSLRSMWESVTMELVRNIKENVFSVNSACEDSRPACVAVSGRHVEETNIIPNSIVDPYEIFNFPAEVEDSVNSQSKRRKTSCLTELVSEDLEVYTPHQLILQNEGDPSGSDSGDWGVATGNSLFFDDFLTEDDLCISNLFEDSFDPKDVSLKGLVHSDPKSGSSVPTVVDFGVADLRNNEFVTVEELFGESPSADSELVGCIDFTSVEKWDDEAQEEPLPHVTNGHKCQDDPKFNILKDMHSASRDAKSWVPAGPDIPPEVCKYLTQVGDASSSCSKGRALVLHEKELAHVDRDPEVDIEPKYCPQAVIEWCHLASGPKRESSRSLSLRAKQHLLAVGWRLWYIVKQETRRELRYTSPQGKNYISLVRACKAYMEDTVTREKFEAPSSRDKSSSAIICTGVVQENLLPESSLSALRYTESETAAAELLGKNASQSCDHYDSCQNSMKRKPSRSLIEEGNKRDDIHQNCVSQSSKRPRQVVVPSPMHHNPRTVLSWLIDSNVVLPRAKVCCMDIETGYRMAEGRITHAGIRCNCCQKVFGLASFQAHAGSASHQPTACIYLDDGRSLLQCQKQMIQDNKLKGFSSGPCERLKRNNPSTNNDFICSVCRYGGQLVLCDHCPSAFHLSCLGLKDLDLPEGKWLCPSCQCGICEQSDFNGDIKCFTAKTVISCDQCEREYHVGCIRQREQVKLESCPKGNWFCSGTCEKIFAGLHKILGKSYPVGVKNLSYTILKAYRDGYRHHDLDASETDIMAEHQSKLNVALGVMHECFEPIKVPRTKRNFSKEPRTKRDLIEDVLFNSWSELNRLNFRGFYTMILQREDEMISVATFRVHGAKVAEVPLVGTCGKYRRQGMCSILMGMLQKKLTELGVERLFLPAVAHVLQTWTTAFGFSKMTKSERLKFLQYTFLDFQDTTMCQKILRTTNTTPPTPAEKSSESRAHFAGNQQKLIQEHDHNDKNVDPDRQSVASEVIQAEEIEQCEVVEQ